jgi:hypothetical protein
VDFAPWISTFCVFFYPSEEVKHVIVLCLDRKKKYCVKFTLQPKGDCAAVVFTLFVQKFITWRFGTLSLHLKAIPLASETFYD